MHTEDSDSVIHRAGAALPTIGGLRLIVLDPPLTPQRRRLPRRRAVASAVTERRRGDRRKAKPGIDGLLRTVLADYWK